MPDGRRLGWGVVVDGSCSGGCQQQRGWRRGGKELKEVGKGLKKVRKRLKKVAKGLKKGGKGAEGVGRG